MAHFAELNSSRNVQWGWDPVGGGSDEALSQPNNLKALTSVGDITITIT